MNKYGQSYTNPYATGSSSDAQISEMLKNLQNLGVGTGQQSVAAPAISASPTGSSLKAISSQPSQAATAALPAVASVLGTSGGAGGASAGGLSALGGASGGGGALGAAGSAVGILGGLANIYFGFQAQKLAKKQFNFQKDAYNNNLVNTVQSYNTSLEDRIRARHNTESRSAGETASYLNNNRLQANTVG